MRNGYRFGLYLMSFAVALVMSVTRSFANGQVALVGAASPKERFVDYARNAAKGRFIANTNFWAYGVDISCASPWNSMSGNLRAGTAISPRHIVFANHYPLSVGTRLLFVGADGGVCPVYLTATKRVADCDICIGLLNAELTPNIMPAVILPPNYTNVLGNAMGQTILTLNQHEQGIRGRMVGTSERQSRSSLLSASTITKGPDAALSGTIVTGDSGNPAFLIYKGRAILLYCLLGPHGGSGPALHRYRRQIQDAMDELCPGYKLAEFDFSKVER